MAKPYWTASPLARVKDPTLTDNEVAELLGKSSAAVRGKRQRLGVKGAAAKAPLKAPTTVHQDQARHADIYWKNQHAELTKKYETVLKAGSATARLVERVSELAPLSYETAPAIKVKRGKSGKAQSVVVLLTDTHAGKVVKPEQTLGFAGYDFATLRRRLKFYEDGITSILTDHVNTEVPEIVICIGGDMLDGALSHGVEAGQVNTLFTQFYGASHAIAQFIRNVARLAPKVRVYTAVGNHTRWQNQRKMPTENRFSNLDQFLYAHLQALTREIENIDWTLDAQPFAVFDVQGFRFHLSHGDTLRGGDKALGVPNHSIARLISSTSQLYAKHGQVAPHYYLTGHLHRSIVLPHARGSVIINGGFVGMDNYGLASGFAAVDASQTMFLVHPVYGKTATFDVQLGFAPKDGPLPYDIPVIGEQMI